MFLKKARLRDQKWWSAPIEWSLKGLSSTCARMASPVLC